MVGQQHHRLADPVGGRGVEGPEPRETEMQGRPSRGDPAGAGEMRDGAARVAAQAGMPAAERGLCALQEPGQRQERRRGGAGRNVEQRRLRAVPQQVRGRLQARVAGERHGVAAAVDQAAPVDGADRGDDRRLAPGHGPRGDRRAGAAPAAPVGERRDVAGPVLAVAPARRPPRLDQPAADIGVERLGPDPEGVEDFGAVQPIRHVDQMYQD
ncbi:hypothetical protein [Methylobacterium oryzae]|uniref:hypothetical protein n=1 Tax=Methylobacterium oryzae TaxID=334852 RepID=UPI002F35DA52